MIQFPHQCHEFHNKDGVIPPWQQESSSLLTAPSLSQGMWACLCHFRQREHKENENPTFWHKGVRIPMLMCWKMRRCEDPNTNVSKDTKVWGSQYWHVERQWMGGKHSNRVKKAMMQWGWKARQWGWVIKSAYLFYYYYTMYLGKAQGRCMPCTSLLENIITLWNNLAGI